jgi:type I restriction enzyme M protein
MLDQETKKKISDLRDTLVGKVPDPKSQVEQIMIALIYKFMNDMDKESTDLGGEASFFVGNFEKYSWGNLFGTKVSGSELVDLYSTAVESMEKNPNIPQLFRDIFKNAYIPYKDAETLRLFLSQINDFEYSKDSEQLGDAFEHILNSLSSQGTAGQFRTPRHIIDFIIEIVDPKKDETVLDPASGTSGFLISAFKHIVNSNSEKSSGDLLSAAERKKIMKNINGYDISPDMVRIGLANMYLHGFPEPNVVEYDALTSEDRWNEYYDVILANPPFMTPKGGIRPHNKFGLKSNRAEVLFVDYILTHLKPKGRAGIIVPEGIIFQSGKAYKELRKKLVKNGLTRVISLPSGVFKPYSGVKTSIIIIDKSLKNDSVLFSEVNNDGYSLGDQRTPLSQNDLPTILKEIKSKNFINSIGILKEKIVSLDYSLTINSYIEQKIQTDYNTTSLSDICSVDWGNTTLTKKSFVDNGKYIAVSAAGPDGRIDTAEYKSPNIVVSAIGAKCGKVFYLDEPFTAIKNTIVLHDFQSSINEKFLFHVLNSDNKFTRRGGAQPFISKGDAEKVIIPLPPLEKQQEIVNEIEQYQKVIDGAKQVVENYKPSFHIEEGAKFIEFGSVVEISRGGSPRPIKQFVSETDGENWIKIKDGSSSLKYIEHTKEKISEEGTKHSRRVNKGDLILSNSMSFGKPYILKIDGYIHDGWLSIKFDDKKYDVDYLYYLLSSKFIMEQFKNAATGSTVNNLNKELVSKVLIPDYPLKKQKKIAEKLEEERDVILMNTKIIKNFEEKIDELVSNLYKET